MGLGVASNSQSISVYLEGKTSYDLSSASASFMGDHWYINRIIVNPKTERGKGIGSRLLQKLIEEVIIQKGNKIIVTPGGYDMNREKQFNFYFKNGFSKKEDYLEMNL